MSKNKPLLLVERAAIAEDLWVVKTNSLIGYDHVCQTEGEAKGIAVLIANCLTKDRELIQTLVNVLSKTTKWAHSAGRERFMWTEEEAERAMSDEVSALALAGEQGYKPTEK